MTDNEIRIAIAERCGWKLKPAKGISAIDAAWYGDVPRVWHVTTGKEKEIPDYPNDLNAMHEAEKTLSQGDWTVFMPTLHEIAGRAVNLCIHATARQRAEAFLRTVGRWKE